MVQYPGGIQYIVQDKVYDFSIWFHYPDRSTLFRYSIYVNINPVHNLGGVNLVTNITILKKNTTPILTNKKQDQRQHKNNQFLFLTHTAPPTVNTRRMATPSR